jgi:hypothetical protein
MGATKVRDAEGTCLECGLTVALELSKKSIEMGFSWRAETLEDNLK